MVAVEKRGHVSGRLRMAVILDFTRITLDTFITQHIASGSTLYPDGLKTFTGLEEAGYTHIPGTQPRRTALRKSMKSVVPLADRAVGNLKQWLIGTHLGSAALNSRFTSTSSFFATIAGRHPWLPSRPSSVSELDTPLPRTVGYEGRRIL